jgi:hypothetical protein
MRKLTDDEFEEELKSRTDKVFIDGPYHGMKNYMNFVCNIGHKFTAIAGNVLERGSCPVCSGRMVLVGYNDLWTVRPDVARLLKNSDDGYKYTEHSNQKTDFICSECGKILNKSVTKVSERGLSCDRCSDGISYPNKFIRNLLNQIGIDYIPEYHFKNNKYSYDVYIKDLSVIIEMHGLQHYEECALTQRTLAEEQENDKLKYEYAKKHGVQYYIVIDSRESSMLYIKNNIISSLLNNIFDLSCVNWSKCDQDSIKSLFIEFIGLFNSGVSRNDIMKQLKIGDTTMCRWLKQANNANLLFINNGHFLGKQRKIVLLNTHEVFDTIADASRKYNVQKTRISSVCKHKSLYAGIHPITGEPLVWRYLDEYDKNEKIDYSSIRINSRNIGKIIPNNTKLTKEAT